MREWGRVEVMFMCVHLCDAALCRNTVKNMALGLWLVGHLRTVIGSNDDDDDD